MKLANVNLTPTMQCNLRCELCGVLVPHYAYRPQMDIEECERTLDILFQMVDRVGRFQITGGEPLMHPRIDEILQLCFLYEDKFDELWLFSNCAVPFRENVVKVLFLHKDKTLVHCSDYGVKPGIAKENIDMLKEKNVAYRYLKYYGEGQYWDGWVDNGDFVAHHRTSEENKKIFQSCPHYQRGGSWYLRHGQLHWCGRSIRGVELGRIYDANEDYLDLFEDISIIEKKEKLVKLQQADQIIACDYCNGYYGTEEAALRHHAGKQMKKGVCQ